MSTFSWKVLIVDDEPNNLTLLGNILKDHCSLSFATDGKAALEITEKIKPDIILLDIMMPGIDGYETCERLKANSETADIPVIFISALDNIENIVKGYDLGCVDYIPKPFDRAIVLRRVKALLTILGLIKEKSNLVEMNAALLRHINNMIENEENNLLSKIEYIKNDLQSTSESFWDKIDLLRHEIHSKAGLDILNQIEISMQFWDTLNQKINEVNKVVQQLNEKIMGCDNSNDSFASISQQSTESVFMKKVDQDEIDALLAQLD